MTLKFTNVAILEFYKSNFIPHSIFPPAPFRDAQLGNQHFDTHGGVFLQSTKPDISSSLLKIF